VIAADSNLKMTYPDVALFLILSRSLPSSFKPLIRAFVTQPTLSIEEKIDMLVEYEMDMRDEGLNTEKAHIAKSKSKVSKHYHRSSNSDSDEGNVINCYLCHGDQAFRFCSHVKLAGKLLKYHLHQQKKLDQSKKKSSRSGGKKPSRKSHGYKATALTSDDELDNYFKLHHL
jgi:cytochrome c553